MTPSKNKTHFTLAILLFVAAAAVYGITPNQLFSFDSITNAIASERNEAIRWFHPNHPLYPALGALYYRMERLVGYDGIAIYSLARLNALLMASALALLFLGLARKLGAKASAMAVFFLGSGYGIWLFAIDGRAVGVSVFFAALLLYHLLRLDPDKTLSRRAIGITALLSILYVLAHGIAIFHAAAVAGWLVRRKQNRLAALSYVGVVLGGLLLTLGAIYLSVVRPLEPIPFLRWVLGYASYDGSHLPHYSSFWVTSVMESAKGMWSGWKGCFLGDSTSRVVQEAGVLLPIGFLVTLSIVAWKNRASFRSTRSLAGALMVWGALCEIFVAFWSPGQSGFHLHALVPWTVALALLIPPTKTSLYVQAIVASLLFTMNLTGPIRHTTSIANNQGLMALKAVRAHLNPGDTFAAALPGAVPDAGVLMPYFFPELSGGSIEGRLFAFRETSLEKINEAWRKHLARGEKIYLLEDVLDPAVQEGIETRHALPAGALKKLLAGFTMTPAFTLPDTRAVYLAQLKTR